MWVVIFMEKAFWEKKRREEGRRSILQVVGSDEVNFRSREDEKSRHQNTPLLGKINKFALL
jgi:hypothetical protein